MRKRKKLLKIDNNYIKNSLNDIYNYKDYIRGFPNKNDYISIDYDLYYTYFEKSKNYEEEYNKLLETFKDSENIVELINEHKNIIIKNIIGENNKEIQKKRNEIIQQRKEMIQQRNEMIQQRNEMIQQRRGGGNSYIFKKEGKKEYLIKIVIKQIKINI